MARLRRQRPGDRSGRAGGAPAVLPEDAAKLVEFAEAGFPGLAVAAIRVAPFAAWCAEQGQEPDSPEARAEYAAYLTAHGDHDVMAWPPGRNQQCWCGSGHKYKKCCAAASFIDTEPAP